MSLINDLNHLKQKLMNEMILEYSCGDFEKADKIGMLLVELENTIRRLENLLKTLNKYI